MKSSKDYQYGQVVNVNLKGSEFIGRVIAIQNDLNLVIVRDKDGRIHPCQADKLKLNELIVGRE